MTNKPAEVRGTTRGLRRVGGRVEGRARAREREREENTDETRARARRQTRREGGEGVTRKKSAREMKTDTTDRGLFSAGETNPLDTG